MGIVRPSEIPRFLAAGGREAPIILIFGSDEGLVRARLSQLVITALGKDHDPLSLVELDAEAINDDPPRLLDEANSIGMFGGKRVIVVRGAGKLAKSAWQPLFELPPLDSLVLFQADDLAKTNALRLAAEGDARAMALVCYPPSNADVSALIDEKCRAAGMSMAAPARAVLLDMLGADYALSESEIDKLVLYARGKLSIEIADIEAVVVDASGGAGSDPLDRAFEGKLEDIEIAATRALREGVNASGLIAMALNHAMMLRRLVEARRTGNFDAAFKAERVFFRRQDRVRSQAQRWEPAALTRAIDTLMIAQEQSRRVSALEDAVAIRALWSIALAARR